ncbi:MAG: hypothetical protein ABI999_07565 [Acidobacteriota bacterium]
MSDEQISDLEQEFRDELKGDGSFSPHLADGTAKGSYIGFDIHPEDIEALFFEGIGIPRWESIKADTVEEQEALYMERFNDLMSKYPLMGRANDTDQKAEFTSAEVPSLLEECDRISSSTSNPKAVRALQKMSLAASKAVAKDVGLYLISRQGT